MPQKLATTAVQNATTDYDPVGCLVPLNNAAEEFNGQLRALCEELRSDLNGTTIVYVDIYSVKYDLIANPAKYGKTPSPLVAYTYMHVYKHHRHGMEKSSVSAAGRFGPISLTAGLMFPRTRTTNKFDL